MAQARRIKPTAQKSKKHKATQVSWELPWGQILLILGCGIIIGMLLNGMATGNPKFGAGLKQILAQKPESTAKDPEISALLENQTTEKDFTFYELLKDIEKVMPDDLPEATPQRPPENIDYFLQAASFKSYADAEKFRARLALKGFKSVTQAREVEGKGTYYRIRLGPYADKRKAKTAKNKLQKLGVRPLVYSVKKTNAI